MSNNAVNTVGTPVIDLGIEADDRAKVASALSIFLASTYTLYLKTQNFHWNVTGPHFISYHAMFEEQYVELRDAVDEIAERIRALGHVCPASFRAYAELSVITEEDHNIETADEMIRILLSGHEIASREARNVLKVAEEAGDEVSVDMMVERMTIHDKTAWMLRSTIA